MIIKAWKCNKCNFIENNRPEDDVCQFCLSTGFKKVTLLDTEGEEIRELMDLAREAGVLHLQLPPTYKSNDQIIQDYLKEKKVSAVR